MRQCEAVSKPHKELILDVKTRWNSTYNMIERCCELREVSLINLNFIIIIFLLLLYLIILINLGFGKSCNVR
jgi:hypothetical protein